MKKIFSILLAVAVLSLSLLMFPAFGGVIECDNFEINEEELVNRLLKLGKDLEGPSPFRIIDEQAIKLEDFIAAKSDDSDPGYDPAETGKCARDLAKEAKKRWANYQKTSPTGSAKKAPKTFASDYQKGHALPPCPEDQDERYHNCYGTDVGDDGTKYVGEFKNDLWHGYGVEYAADGTVESQGYWENDELVRSTKQVVKKQVATASQQAEIVFWETIKNSTRSEHFLAYLTEFPNGVFIALAKLKLKNLKPTQGKKKAEAEQKQQAKLVGKKAEAERQRIAEEKARNLAKAKAKAEKKRLAKLARKNDEEAERKLAEARGSEQKRLAEQNKPAGAIPSIEFGDYHALVIGNNNYTHLPKLKNAVGDAKDVSSVLTRMYDFQVSTLLNATRSDIFSALVKLRAELTWGSNLLIYYAGHGIVDEYTGVGFWQPVDAAEEDPSNWISNSDVTNMLNAIGAKHVMIIADSCYSGTLVRSTGKGLRTAKDRDVWLKRMSQKRSRTALVSGGIEPVMDGGGGKNSVFAKALLDVLKENQSVIDGTAVFEALKRRVVLGSDQTPEYSDIRKAEHDGGDFLLVRRGAITEQPSITEGADALEGAKKQCSQLGFTEGTVEHGKCVMKLYK
ncbi:MAG: caspase family protein [Alphaproteobacteria bacterium]|nr:caspase family protein [Alphaproteobacteria bacterium]